MSFDEEPAEIPKVLEDQAAHHRVERRISKRQRLVQIVRDETHLVVGSLPPGLLEHSRGEVDRRDPGPRFRQPRGVPAGPAAEVQHVDAAYVAERLAHARLLEGGQRIGVVVVDVRPPVVTVAHAG